MPPQSSARKGGYSCGKTIAMGEDKASLFHAPTAGVRSPTPALGGKPLFASAIKLVAHQNWGNKSLCASVRQRLNKAMQPGDPAEPVRVPAPGCRGPALRGGGGNPGTGQGAGRGAGLSGSHALGKFPGCSPSADSSRGPTGAHAPHRSGGQGTAPRAWGRRPKTSRRPARAHAPGKVGVSRGPGRREKPPAAHCLVPRPRGAHLRFHRAPRRREG